MGIDKTTYFQSLVIGVNRIEGIAIDLTAKGYDSHRDALAFYVEQISEMYPASQATVMIYGMSEKVTQCDTITARHLVDEQITTVYEAFLVKKISICSGEERSEWEDVKEMYMMRKGANSERFKRSMPVEFGGIRHDVLPKWYEEKFVK